MYRYILKRLLWLVPVLILVSFTIFFIMDLAPGDPVLIIAGEQASDEVIERVREEYGFNDPMIVRYFRYMGGLLKGDLGVSYISNKDVLQTYMQRIPETAKLAIAAILVATLISIPIGIYSAVNQNTWKDTTSIVAALLGLSMPQFWLGLLLIIAFALNLQWFPSGGSTQGIRSLILPAITIGTGYAALMTRTTRSSMLDVIRQDYLRTARSKGVSEKLVINKHALRNALIPIITVAGVQFAYILGGAVLVETVFAWPGVGRLTVDAINQRDIPMVTGCVIITTMIVCVVQLLVDILYAYVDPRIKAQYMK
ncbi:nickel ABC transporter permease [Oscillospiraceae bacterium PP1C4]